MYWCMLRRKKNVALGTKKLFKYECSGVFYVEKRRLMSNVAVYVTSETF